MNRYGDITQLFDEVDSNIARLNKAYELARVDDEVSEVLKPTVKSSLEHLRSILEYSAQDIWSSYTKKQTSPYFPYGRDERAFIKSVERNLPGLCGQRPEIYSLVDSIQPHRCGDSWLYDLCEKTNINKHRRLTKQIRRNSESSIVNIGNGSFVFGGGANVVFKDCMANGVSVGVGGKAVLSDNMTVKQLRKELGMVSFSKEFEWVEFAFDGTLIDARKLIMESRKRISVFVEDLRLII